MRSAIQHLRSLIDKKNKRALDWCDLLLKTTGAAAPADIREAEAKLTAFGCGDNSCILGAPSGMATNGGCRCDQRYVEGAPGGSEAGDAERESLAQTRRQFRQMVMTLRRVASMWKKHAENGQIAALVPAPQARRRIKLTAFVQTTAEALVEEWRGVGSCSELVVARTSPGRGTVEIDGVVAVVDHSNRTTAFDLALRVSDAEAVFPGVSSSFGLDLGNFARGLQAASQRDEDVVLVPARRVLELVAHERRVAAGRLAEAEAEKERKKQGRKAGKSSREPA